MRSVLFLLVFGLTGAAILIGLGSWQMQRLTWKQGVLAQIDSRIAAAPVPVPQDLNPERDRYLPVTGTGTLEPAELHVLVSRKRVGAGYRLIAPLTLDDGRRVMLDRGFVPVEDKDKARSTGPLSVIGNLHWPREVDSYTPDPDRTGNIWFAREVPLMAAALQTEPVLIIAKSKTDPGVTPMPVDSSGIPNDHLQYAITWFSLALIWILMTGAFLWRSRAAAQGKT